jgi:hypothetical protein
LRRAAGIAPAWLLAAALAAAPAARAGDDAAPDPRAGDLPQESAADSLDTGGSGSISWLRRNFLRYFANSTPTGDELEGRTLELSGRYRAYAGMEIAVVIVHAVDEFDPDPDPGEGGLSRLTALANPLRSYTRESVIRNYFVFEQGQPLDPNAVADTERLLRELEYIGDAKIYVVPLSGDDDQVAVIIEVRDRWPLGASGTLKDVDRYQASLYHTNLAGLGIRFSNEALYRAGYDPELGYRGELRKQNMAGSWITVGLTYEDSWRRLQRRVEADRVLAHPGVSWVAGFRLDDLRERDSGERSVRATTEDTWGGPVLPLGSRRRGRDGVRSIVVPALRFVRVEHSERPFTSPDSNRYYQNRRSYLAGVTYETNRYLKTAYLFRMGETEDIVAGTTLKLTAMYEDREFEGRTGGVAQFWRSDVTDAGAVWLYEAGLGGYWRGRAPEDDTLMLRAAHITPLLGDGEWRRRWFFDLRYHLGWNQRSSGGLNLGDQSGIRGMEDSRVLGDQRLVLKNEIRLFTPLSLAGFRFMAFGFADVGAAAGERDPLLNQRIYGSAGLGFRVYNPGLVFSPFQVRLAVLRSIDDNGAVVSIKAGGADYPEIKSPGVAPGGYAFR